MGLDVYFRLAKKTRKRENYASMSEFINAIEVEEDARVLNELKGVVKERIKEMRDAEKEWKEKHPKEKFTMDDIHYLRYNFYHEMAEYFPYEFRREPILKAESIKDIGDWAKEQYKNFYKSSTAYFRKVNCIYRYFEDRLENETCIVEKSDITDIMERAIRILSTKDMELGEELLPNRAGFFFGSTDYDEWYLCGMVEILKEFGTLLRKWEDDDICYVVMSW